MKELIAKGLVQPAGLSAFEARREDRSGIYAYEQRSPELIEPYAAQLKKHRTAWKSFRLSHRRTEK